MTVAYGLVARGLGKRLPTQQAGPDLLLTGPAVTTVNTGNDQRHYSGCVSGYVSVFESVLYVTCVDDNVLLERIAITML